MSSDRSFDLELEMTETCNFRCEYCFEPGASFCTEKRTITQEELEKAVSFFKRVIDSRKRRDLRITFWGGEPGLCWEKVSWVIDQFEEEKNVSFFMYTNGSNLDRLEKYMTISKNGSDPTLSVQVSYDGLPIHSLRRNDSLGQDTSKKTRDLLVHLFQNDLFVGTKSTVMPVDFSLLPECWKDFRSLRELNPRIEFAPTIDYRAETSGQEDRIQELRDALREMVRLETTENIGNRPVLSWFNQEKRSLCLARATFFMVKMNGEVVPCHGSLYGRKRPATVLTKVSDPGAINTLEKECSHWLEVVTKEPEKCKSCLATFCCRCNSTAFDESSSSDEEKAWMDFDRLSGSCKYYRVITAYSVALRNSMRF